MIVRYKDIISYVYLKYKYKPKTCWIAHVKEILGIDMKFANNRIDVLKRKNPCPIDKINHIKEAFEELSKQT